MGAAYIVAGLLLVGTALAFGRGDVGATSRKKKKSLPSSNSC